MRIEFIEAANYVTAKRRASFTPVALRKVCGGYMAFESWDDLAIWDNQN